ncbi:MAG: MtaA/CmuA family methyltransferase [Dehalococcoidales bacterium]|nr:MtaA/CmuA family methyltransferase [Dehalococcoidales bacterium]
MERTPGDGLMMSPKRRFLSGLFGGRVDRVPVGNPTSVATVELQQETEAFFPEAHLDGEKMARLAAGGHEILGFDTVMPYFSVEQEAEALGCEVDWGAPDMMPVERTHPFAESSQAVMPADFLERRATRAVLDAMAILRKRYGGQVAIIGKVMGPWTLSYHTHGVQSFLLKTLLEPDSVRVFLDRLKEVTIAFGRAQVEAGADVLCLADHATGDLVSAEMYRDFLLPVHREIIKELGCPLILHICGNTTSRLEYIAQAGFDCFHFESKVDAFQAKEIVGNRLSLIGNVNNPQTLLQGTPEDVRREVFYALDAGVEIAAPECAVPLPTPNRNLRALVEAARDYRQGRAD